MEPSLSEITNVNSDAERSGLAPTPVLDNSRIVDTLNQNAKFHAENTWRKYNEFLQNKKDLFKNISDIQGLETAQQDKEVLKKQAGDILSDILKDPSIAMGGQGYDELQGKIAKFKSDAMTSKQDKLDDDANAKFMDRNPELYTDENKAKRETFWKAPLGARKSVILDMPTVFDEKTAFEGIIKGTTQPYTAIVGKNGEAGGDGYIESGNEVNPNAISKAWDMALEGQQDKYGHSILKAVQKNYDNLPDDEKKRYEAAGGIRKFFSDRGQQYLNAYFPEGTYEKTKEGNYRFGKKLTADPNYLGAERLSLQQRELNERTANDKAQRAIGWAHIGIEQAKLDKAKTEDQDAAATVLNQMSNSINNGEQVKIHATDGSGEINVTRISDPLILQKFSQLDKEGKIVNSPDAIDYDKDKDQLLLQFFAPTDKKSTALGGHHIVKTVPMDKRVWAKILTSASFPNKEIGGINSLLEDAFKANDNSLFKISQKFKQQGQQQTAPEQTPANKPSSKSYSVKGKTYTLDQLHKWYTDEQIQSAIKRGLIK